MIQAGTVTKIEGNRIWALVRPEGGTCADCSCEKPTRTLEARNSSVEPLAAGDQVILESSRFFAGLSAFSLLTLFTCGGVLAWTLTGNAAGEILQALSALGGGAVGLLVALAIFAPFRSRQLPLAKKISVQLHSQNHEV